MKEELAFGVQAAYPNYKDVNRLWADWTSIGGLGYA
jgi:hypothetical protein